MGGGGRGGFQNSSLCYGPPLLRRRRVGRDVVTRSRSISRYASTTVSASTVVTSRMMIETSGTGFTDLTAEVVKFVREAGAREGAVALFIRHTSASVTIQENADPSVLADLTTAPAKLAPENTRATHSTDEPD